MRAWKAFTDLSPLDNRPTTQLPKNGVQNPAGPTQSDDGIEPCFIDIGVRIEPDPEDAPPALVPP
ncbi:protein of unknown function (plasmid) [Caballeronia sp. S22]